MATRATNATKHWAWDKVGQNFYAAVVNPPEELETERSSITVTVELERGGKAGGWWIRTTDSTWPAHADTFSQAMNKAERIRKAREAEMDALVLH